MLVDGWIKQWRKIQQTVNIKNSNILKITVPFRAKLLLVKKELKVSVIFVCEVFHGKFLQKKRYVNLKTDYKLSFEIIVFK